MGSSETMATYPQRAGEPDCRDFLRTGRCKYGDSCKYHHPIGGTRSNDPNEPPFPIRPDEPVCQYYLKNATCKFGQSCKFHHPPHILSSQGNAAAVISMGNANICTPAVTRITRQLSDVREETNIRNSTANDRFRDNREILPQRPGEPECIYYLRNRRCKYGSSCKYHHPPNPANVTLSHDTKESFIANKLQASVNGMPMIYRRERSASENMVDSHEIQSMVAGGLQRHQFSMPQSPFIHESVQRQMQGQQQNYQQQNYLGTIDNSFQQYPHGAMDMNNVILGPNFQQAFSNVPSISPKMGSPSMSSTTVASSYDTASLEALPPSRIQGQNSSVQASPSQGLHSQKISYSELSSLNASTHQQQQQVSHTNSNGEMGNLQLCMPTMPSVVAPSPDTASSGGDTTRRRNSHSLLEGQQFAITRQTLSISSNASYASLSPTSEKNDRQGSEGIRSIGSETPQRSESETRNVDDGFSMMTDALLTMLDTQDDATQKLCRQQQQQQQQPNRNVFLNKRPKEPSRYLSRNSLPDYLQSDNSSRTNQMKPTIPTIQYPQKHPHHSQLHTQQYDSTTTANMSNLNLQQDADRSRIVGQVHYNNNHHQSNMTNNQGPAVPSVDSPSGRPPTHFYIPS